MPAGTEGRLYFEDATGRGIVYPSDPEKTADAHLRPGVFTLGEIGYVDDDGFVFITDRFSDMIVSGGVNIYPAEAEQVLIEHPGVADVAVIGVPHRDMGEEVKALVVPARPGRPARRRRADRLLPRAAGRLQVPPLGRHRRHRRPHDDGQGQQAGAAGRRSGTRPAPSVADVTEHDGGSAARLAGRRHGARRRPGRDGGRRRPGRLRRRRALVRPRHVDRRDDPRGAPPPATPPA